MKKISYIVLSLCLSVGVLFAQTNRTVTTIVTDVLAQMPAQNSQNYNKQMADLASTGEEGVLLLVSYMNSPGPESNAMTDFALSGLTSYVMEAGRENLRLTVANAYIKALNQTNERETKAFLVRQLQLCGKDEAVDALGRYLTSEELCGPAARALASINTDKARQAMQSALMRRMGNAKTQADVVLAIGEARMAIGEELIAGFVNSPDENLRRATYYTLGRIGTVASLKSLQQAAARVNYTIENTGANEAYIALIKKVIAEGNIKEGEKAANDLLKAATKVGATHSRIAALEMQFGLSNAPLKLLNTALKDKDIEYRNAALNFASAYANEVMYIDLIKDIAKKNAALRVDILNWIGRESKEAAKNQILRNLDIRFDLPAHQVLYGQLNAKEFEVREAAAWAITKIGNSGSIPQLANLLTDASPEVVALGKETLMAFSGNITQAIVRVIPAATDAGKVAALQLLALRKADQTINTVIDQTKSSSPEVSKAAYTALKDVVAEKDFTLLCGMLESAAPDAVGLMQQAVIASIASQSPEAQMNSIDRRMIQAGNDKRYLYYVVLSATGNKEALPVIVNGFKQSQGVAKDQAFEAIYSWKGTETAEELYNVCLDPAAGAYFDRALDAYVRLVSSNTVTPENRLIFLRKAMEIAKTDEQKNTILRRIERTGTFLAMIYAGEFLDNKPVQQAAANAVMNIANNNLNYTGQIVRDLLNKVIAVLDNPDAEYQKEAIRKRLSEMPNEEGYVSMFNGRDLTGWKGLVKNPIQRAKMTEKELAAEQVKADEQMRKDWKVEDGCLVFDGTGYDNLCTVKQYGDFEMYVDWLLDTSGKDADAGIYLRGTPQVQMWDTARVRVGAQVGSGGLYNNRVHESKPLVVADNKLGEWNTMFIKMVGDRVTVYLNGVLVTDNVILENYWDRKLPIFPIEQIELQAHGSKVYYRNLFVKELAQKEPFKLSAEEEKEGYKILFDGTNMHEWAGNTTDYTMEEGTISLVPGKGSGGNLYTKSEYANFVFRFEFQLTPAANNGLGIRTPMEGDAAYVGMELQILDSEHPVYRNLQIYQYHGSVYGVIPAERGHLKPVGEWNNQEVIANGDNIKITLNGHVILDGNIREAAKNGTADGKEHPGLFNKTGHIGFLGHGSPVKFKNIRIKELK
ncbi:DUF1080 domain-containing protein [Parabacteroides sp. OttesenSCG-928-G07]|nr:DUF1080 domain-containing protein [Parabacteroides sp. OttesenSCG-928-G21]MDL2277441.1 DUF1080 domain-containing protein [Parabacteroides sp. OttesenSCG-928-G07]